MENTMNHHQIRKSARHSLSSNWFSLSFLYALLYYIPVLILYVASVFAAFSLYFRGFNTSHDDNVDFYYVLVACCLLIVYVISSSFVSAYMQALYYDVDRFVDSNISLLSRMSRLKKSKIILTLFKVQLVVTTKTLLWSTLLIVPGIVKSLSYSQAIFIAIDSLVNKEVITASNAILKSEEMMKHQKLNLFKFILSFTVWLLVTTAIIIISYDLFKYFWYLLGFIFVFVVFPVSVFNTYYKMSLIIYYHNLKREILIEDY